MTLDTWNVAPDTWHMTRDMWQILSQFQLPRSYGLVEIIFWSLGGKGWLTLLMNEWMNEWMRKVILEQPRLHRVY